MDAEDYLMIAGVLGIVAGGGAYGYWIGLVSRQRGWRFKTTKRYALLPPVAVGCMLLVASLVSHFGWHSPQQEWQRFPWVICTTAGFLALLVAAKTAHPGVPIRSLNDEDVPVR